MTLEDISYEHLIGIPFTGIGQRDCYALVIDFFFDNFGIVLPKFARPSDWEANKLNLIVDLYEAGGFKMITDWTVNDLRPADVFALSIGQSNPDHLAIYVGNGDMLHHLYGQFSKAELYRGFWRNHTAFILRHPNVPDLRPPIVTKPLLDFLNARNAPLTA